MTPQEIAEARPELLGFAAEMFGGLARKDQRAAGELYVRGLLTDGQRKPMQPMAARLGVDHQRLQQFITSSTWDYAAVRRNVARWFAASFPVEALVAGDTGFPKDGKASPCVARQYSGTLGKIGNCRVGVSVHLVNEHASCAANWRLFCPESWDDQALDDPVVAAAARRRRELSRIPGQVRHTEKWRLALEMIQEMTGPDGWGVLEQPAAAGGARPVVVADIAYGDNALIREGLTARGWRYVVAVKGSPRAYPCEPGTAPDLHRRAYAWYRDHGMTGEAISHAIAAGAHAEAAGLIEASWVSYANACRYNTVLAWIGQLPEEAQSGTAGLLLVKAWLLSLTGKREEAGQVIAAAERLGEPGGEARPAGFSSAGASLTMLRACCPWGT